MTQIHIIIYTNLCRTKFVYLVIWDRSIVVGICAIIVALIVWIPVCFSLQLPSRCCSSYVVIYASFRHACFVVPVDVTTTVNLTTILIF